MYLTAIVTYSCRTGMSSNLLITWIIDTYVCLDMLGYAGISLDTSVLWCATWYYAIMYAFTLIIVCELFQNIEGVYVRMCALLTPCENLLQTGSGAFSNHCSLFCVMRSFIYCRNSCTVMLYLAPCRFGPVGRKSAMISRAELVLLCRICEHDEYEPPCQKVRWR